MADCFICGKKLVRVNLDFIISGIGYRCLNCMGISVKSPAKAEKMAALISLLARDCSTKLRELSSTLGVPKSTLHDYIREIKKGCK
ncbi:MAG: hypothetical protein QXU88_01530, partial [Candidatus Woesearchaeota archaeon]